MLKIAPLLIVTLATSPALAGATPWQDIAPGVKARLISADKLSDGTLLAGLQLDMPANTKTYWRVPGETGIPSEFDFSASVGLTSGTIEWPYPQIDRSQGYLDYVYYGPTVIPVRFASPQVGAMIEASVTLGICSDVCVPAQARFSLPVTLDKPDLGQSIRLDQAEAEVPVAWDKPDLPFRAITTAPTGIAVASPDPSIDMASVIADVGDPAILFETPQKSPDTDLWTLKLLGGAAATGLEGRGIQLTFKTPSGPYVFSGKIAAPAR